MKHKLKPYITAWNVGTFPSSLPACNCHAKRQHIFRSLNKFLPVKLHQTASIHVIQFCKVNFGWDGHGWVCVWACMCVQGCIAYHLIVACDSHCKYNNNNMHACMYNIYTTLCTELICNARAVCIRVLLWRTKGTFKWDIFRRYLHLNYKASPLPFMFAILRSLDCIICCIHTCMELHDIVWVCVCVCVCVCWCNVIPLCL